jgi:hypothetical protein
MNLNQGVRNLREFCDGIKHKYRFDRDLRVGFAGPLFSGNTAEQRLFGDGREVVRREAVSAKNEE